MQLFYGLVQGDNVLLDGEEARHAAKVLRKKPGDNLDVIDGSGTLFHCKITAIDRDKLVAAVTGCEVDFGKVPYELHLAIAPTKNMDRLEWLLEKATEMGLASVTPLVTKNSERIRLREDRLQRILISAAKQSYKGHVPTLHPLVKFEAFIKQPFAGQRFLAHCYESPRKSFAAVVDATKPVQICIGPEGDFTTLEVETAVKNGFEAVSLGASRLRTETAGLVGVSVLYNLTS
jgi:16S rRNA (uracil1498-N3)-methyltransferase